MRPRRMSRTVQELLDLLLGGTCGGTMEIEIETAGKSGRFIGELWLDKSENSAVALVLEGGRRLFIRIRRTRCRGRGSCMLPRRGL